MAPCSFCVDLFVPRVLQDETASDVTRPAARNNVVHKTLHQPSLHALATSSQKCPICWKLLGLFSEEIKKAAFASTWSRIYILCLMNRGDPALKKEPAIKQIELVTASRYHYSKTFAVTTSQGECHGTLRRVVHPHSQQCLHAKELSGRVKQSSLRIGYP